MGMHDELSVRCIICLQHFEVYRSALCCCVEVPHFVCNADLDTWVWSDSGLVIPCPACNALDSRLASPTPEEDFDLEGLCLQLEGLRLD
jgi:hypothetical protein